MEIWGYVGIIRNVLDQELKLIKEVALPSVMREGWGITHDYQKDFYDISRISEQVSKKQSGSIPQSIT